MISLPRFLAVLTDQKKLPSLLKWNRISKNHYFGENVGKTWFYRTKKSLFLRGASSHLNPLHITVSPLGWDGSFTRVSGKIFWNSLAGTRGPFRIRRIWGSNLLEKVQFRSSKSRDFQRYHNFFAENMSIPPSNSGTPTPRLFVKQSSINII